ncbi:MAG TPA: hypothetical protein VHV81_05570 [Steroidobacteraceae bacterium]|jgi:hypothetical protein|nr:hypothetical protein [Steroidobacteraceae bacterium]
MSEKTTGGAPPRRAARPARKHLTPQERELDTEMLAMLEWAARYPKRWHDIGDLEASRQAAELLAKRGLIEIRQPGNQYRIKKTKGS